MFNEKCAHSAEGGGGGGGVGGGGRRVRDADVIALAIKQLWP